MSEISLDTGLKKLT